MTLKPTRNSLTRKAKINDIKFFITIGWDKEGQLRELFIKADDPQLQGWGNAVGILWSLCLQADVPMERICKKMVGQSFEPSGFTKHEGIGFAKSIVDYIAKWMMLEFESEKKI